MQENKGVEAMSTPKYFSILDKLNKSMCIISGAFQVVDQQNEKAVQPVENFPSENRDLYNVEENEDEKCDISSKFESLRKLDIEMKEIQQ